MIKFPTTYVFIDDNKEFLESLKIFLERMKNPMAFFSDPYEAIEFINSNESLQIAQSDFWEKYDKSPEETNDDLILLKQSQTQNIIKNPSRFRQVSCVISDYDMGSMDGIELFSMIKHPYVRKILLTGIASAEYGINAFNNGKINQFLQKDNECLYQVLKPTIQDQENSFFMNFNFSNREKKSFLEMLNEFEKENAIVEKYSLDSLGSMLLLDEEGRQWILYIFDKNALEKQLMYAKDFNASTDIIRMIEKRRKAFCFYSFDENDPIPNPDSWKNYMKPLEYVEQDNIYYCLFKPAKIQNIVSFEQYLKDFS